MHRAIVLIGPGSIGKDPLDAEADFGFSLLLPDHGGQPAGDFFAPLRKIFRNIKEQLRPIVCRRFAPAFRFACPLDGITNVLAVAKRRFPKQTPVCAAHFDAVTRIRPRLLAADVELYGAIDRGSREIGRLIWWLIDRERRCMNRSGVLKPGRLEIFEEPPAPTRTSITALAIASETAGGVEEIRAVDPNHPGLKLRCNVK